MSETDEASKARKEINPIKIVNLIASEQLAKDMKFSITNLSDAMMQQASLFVHYGTLAAKASHQVDSVKMLLEVAESKVYRMLRDKAVEEVVKVTEAQLEKSVATHEKIIALKRVLNEAKQIEANAKIAVEGFRHRRDMLVQQGLLSREEMKGEVSINRRNAVEAAQEAQKERFLSHSRSGEEVE